MLECAFACLIFIGITSRRPTLSSLTPYQHPSLRPRQTEFVSQPKPSNKAYRGSTAIRTKANRHNRNRNKA